MRKRREDPQRHTRTLGERLGAGAPGRTFLCPKDRGAMSRSGQDAGGSERAVSRGIIRLGAPLELELSVATLEGRRGVSGSRRCGAQGTAQDQLRGAWRGRSHPDASVPGKGGGPAPASG